MFKLVDKATKKEITTASDMKEALSKKAAVDMLYEQVVILGENNQEINFLQE